MIQLSATTGRSVTNEGSNYRQTLGANGTCYGDKNLGVVSVASCSNRRTTYTTITVFLAIRVDQMGQTIGSPYTLIATISFTNDVATRCSRLEPCALKGARTVRRATKHVTVMLERRRKEVMKHASRDRGAPQRP